MKIKRILWAALIAFVALNIIAFIHAYKFTHFSTGAGTRTKDPKELSAFDKAKTLFTGINNPRPENKSLPMRQYFNVTVNSTVDLACWKMDVPNAKGTVILFHGYSGEKSSLLSRADEFMKLGYNTFLVDFMGSGGSAGNSTSIGYIEGEQVKDCFEYFQKNGEQNIFLFGTSMGAAAILKAMNDYSLKPSGILLECPFGLLYKTVCARFKLMGVPSFPMASMLTFWGGVQNGYWAFSHNPARYATSVTCPTLLLFGEADNRVSREEIDLIYENLKGKKTLKTYPNVGHAIFTPENQASWISDVSSFFKDL